jgi:hypothetical protein
MKKLLWLAAPFVLAVGVMAGGTAAFAASWAAPATPPGQGECSHGNTGKACRPDPSTSGKDCNSHGNGDIGGVNEDHCRPTTPTNSTNEPTKAPLTTTDHSSTSALTSTTAAAGANANAPSNGAAPSASVHSVTEPLVKQAAVAETGGLSRERKASGLLPFTGLPIWIVALLGSVILTAGWGIRRLTA